MQYFPGRWISGKGSFTWSPKIPDLTPLITKFEVFSGLRLHGEKFEACFI
jgi:hypothetical protein